MKIKIFVATQKKIYDIKSKIIEPIEIGYANAQNHIKGYINDANGDNISKKNNHYCELTAIYWMWKNVKADYYGLFHYRRMLSFSKPSKKKHAMWIEENILNKNSLDLYSINDETIIELLKSNNYDILAPTAFHNISNYKQFQCCHDIDDLNLMLDTIKNKFPKFLKSTNNYLKSKDAYICNMFVMRADLFNEYCSFMFGVLNEIEQRIELKNKSIYQSRIMGFLGERLTGIFIYYCKHVLKSKIKHLDIVYFNETSAKKYQVNPLVCDNPSECVVTLASNNYYVPYTSVLIQSIIENSNKNNNYKIIIFNDDITDINKSIILSMISKYNNFKIEFVDIIPLLHKIASLPINQHFTHITYVRFFIPIILSEYKKVLYLDNDMVVNIDIAALFNMDFDGKKIIATVDADHAGQYNDPFNKTIHNQTNLYLKLKNPFKYFQAGVLLFNIDKIKTTYDLNNILKLASDKNMFYLDQDVLNIYFHGEVKYIDMSWNFLFNCLMQRERYVINAPYYIYNEYKAAGKNPKIVHYAGSEKPWGNPFCDHWYDFYKYAKNSPFYPQIFASSVPKYSPIVKVSIFKKFIAKSKQIGLFNTIVLCINRMLHMRRKK